MPTRGSEATRAETRNWGLFLFGCSLTMMKTDASTVPKLQNFVSEMHKRVS